METQTGIKKLKDDIVIFLADSLYETDGVGGLTKELRMSPSQIDYYLRTQRKMPDDELVNMYFKNGWDTDELIAVQEESAIMRGLSKEDAFIYCSGFRAMYKFLQDTIPTKPKEPFKRKDYSMI